jgi:hypothetical protein
LCNRIHPTKSVITSMADSETQEKERTEGIGNANNDAHVESDDVRSVEQENYPTGWRLWTIVAALVVGSFCYALVRLR